MRVQPPRSLVGQFALLHVAIALIAAAALPFGVAALLHRVAHHYQHEVLQRQAQAIVDLLGTQDPAQAVAAVDVLAGGLTLAVVDPSRHVLAQRGVPRPRTIASIPLKAHSQIKRAGTVATISRPVGGRWVVVAQDDAAPEVVTDDVVRTFLERFVLLLLPLALLFPLVGAWIAYRLTRRMTAASTIAAQIGPRTLDRRLPLGTLPTEVEPLALATNAALDRLEQAFAAQAAFAADIAHELRTPLAVLRLRADAVTDPATRMAILTEVERAARVIGQLLGLADLEHPEETGCAPVYLLALAQGVVADRAPSILAGGRTIALEDEGAAACTGYAGAITLALENLIDNAVRHTPPGTHITVTAGPGARLCVADDGPPLPSADLDRMATRHWRGEAPMAQGSGLGLSIVNRVAAAHGGVLNLRPSPGGSGLQATLELEASDVAQTPGSQRPVRGAEKS